MTDGAAGFTYTNLNPRKSGRFLRVASRVLPGVGRVQAQAVPYAAAWRAANLRALAGGGPLWVALGDSLSQGVGASAYDRGWVSQLAELLEGHCARSTPDRTSDTGAHSGQDHTSDTGAHSTPDQTSDTRAHSTPDQTSDTRAHSTPDQTSDTGAQGGQDRDSDTGACGGSNCSAYRIVNLSMTGARVDDVLSRQLPALESLGVVPDLVTLLVGSNDLFRRAGRADLASRYETVLRRLPETTVVVATLPNPSTAARALNRVTLTVAAERGFAVADTRRDPRTQFWAGKLAADRFHPNDRGYAAIAGVFLDAYVAMSTKRE